MLQICPGKTSSTASSPSRSGGGPQQPPRRITDSAGNFIAFGSITETWKDRHEWSKFRAFLATMNEGTDSDGRKMTLDRYATFLELYVRLDQVKHLRTLFFFLIFFFAVNCHEVVENV